MSKQNNTKPRFEDLDLSDNLLKQLFKLGFEHPTPIQTKAIPAGLKGEDVIGIAQTGTGKTLAFSIPMIQQLASGETMGLVILPTRELALQVDEEIKKIGRYFGVKTAVLIGGASANVQMKSLKRNPNVVIATPGRLIDFLQQKAISLNKVSYLVLDEADRMLDMGFEPQIRKILAMVPEKRQTMLFSATMPDKISSIANKYMKTPVRVEIARAGTAADRIDQEAYIVDRHEKLSLLHHLLKETEGPVLVFSRTKHGAKKITSKLNKLKHRVAEIHSNKSQSQRKQALDGFKSGKYRVLIATDIASRGIDVEDIELVINYDLPDQIEDYVHRIGRTGRAGKAGKAVSFVAPNQTRELVRIERMVRSNVPTVKMPQMEAVDSGPRTEDRGRYAPRGQGRSRSGSDRRSYDKPGKSRGQRHSKSGSRGKGRRSDVDYSARGEGAPIQNLPDEFRAKPGTGSGGKSQGPRGRRGASNTNSRKQRNRSR